MTDKYAVIGNPIAHSKSPQIHAEFAKQTNQDMTYEAILAPLDGFEATVQELIKQGYKGVNVTVGKDAPVSFKVEAFKLSGKENSSEYAKAAGAVNTLIFEGGRIKADNSDGIGLIHDLQNNLEAQLDNKRILLLGAGGAARGVLLPLIAAMPSKVVIVNRDKSKAQILVEDVKKSEVFKKNSQPVQLCVSSYKELSGKVFDIIINATSAGLSDAALPLPDSIFAKNCLAYDMVYGRETPFMAQARATGARVSDGLGMLVEQAAYSFWLWRGKNPDTKPVIEMLRKAN
jgi:shikimate dehydrogenase